MLIEAAHRLKTCLRESDTVARTGGDEFVVLLHKTLHEQDVVVTAAKISTALQAPFIYSGHELHCTTSIGISVYPADGSDAETLLKNADIAMYRAKEEGRNRYRFFESAMNTRAAGREELLCMLRDSIERGELVLHYQPHVTCGSGKISSAEALVRWRHPSLGLLLPGQFLPLAEETGLITAIDEWVIRSACTQNKSWQDAGHRRLRIAVNISSSHFKWHTIVETISRILYETGLDASYLCLEISECAAVKDTASVTPILKKLADMGVNIFIDNFGKGNISINHLKKWPIKTVKIDKSYIEGMTSDHDYESIVQAVITMAHQLKLNVVTEGVETEEQMSFLDSINCDEMQGYYFSKPLPAEDFSRLIRR